MAYRILIIGGGISGLATAYHLQERMPDASIQVLEKADRPGGTIWTERLEGFQIEVGANGFLDSKPSTLALCMRLGLQDRLIPANDAAKHRFLFLDGRLHALPSSLWSFIRTPLLSWRGKLALLNERYRSGQLHEEESIHDFACRRTNREIAETFADALVTGIHAGDPRLLSLPAAFPRVAAMERQHGSVTRGFQATARERRRVASERSETYRPGSRLYSFREGLRLLIETLTQQLRTPALFGVSVRGIERASAGWRVLGDGQDPWPADFVVLACPAHVQATLLAGLDPTLADMIAQIPYAPAAVIALGYRRADVVHSLDGFGYIAPQRTRPDVLGAQWCSSIFPDRAPEDCVLLRAIAGGWHRRDLMTWDDDRLLRAVRAQFRAAMGIEAAPIFHHITRWPNAIPQYHLGHLQRVASIVRRVMEHPGLFLTGNAYHGVALNDCTEQAELVAARVADHLCRVRGNAP